MALSRRQLLATGALALGTPLLTARYAGAVTPAAGRISPARGGRYHPNRAPLAPSAFLRLPSGSVTAHGWLAHQLDLQLHGLCGQYEQLSHFLDFDTSGWVHPEETGWEELTYWLRGYVAMAVATRDEDALATSRRWIDAILQTERADGFFGPEELRTSLNDGPDFWPFLPLLMALRTWYEHTDDARIVPLLSRFTAFMAQQDAGAFDSSWVSYRWGDGLDLAQWLYHRTGEQHLLELCDKMHEFGADWTAEEPPSPHNVNIAQGFREPAQYAVRSGEEELTRATYRVYDSVLETYGQFPGGGFAGDETYRTGFDDPRQGFESCGVVEFMASHELLTRLTGDPLWADRCEDLAFNMLPAALDPEGKGIHYITSANSIDLGQHTKTQGQFQNGFAMQSYQPAVDNYRCCPHNYGFGWPYFVEELWLATPDGGLATAMYAPSEVTAEVADGTEITVVEETDYPFGETVTLTVHCPQLVDFPLVLRVPAWCDEPALTVNGEAVSVAPGPAFATVARTWRDGDEVVLHLPQRTTVRTWERNGDAVSVDHGPLTYSLRIAEEYEQFAGDETFPEYAVHATSPWNYGLALDAQSPGDALEFTPLDGPLPKNPFTVDAAPVHVTAPARRIPEWIADDEHVVAPLQSSPAHSTEPEERVTLIPAGAARLRITAFPTVAENGAQWQPEPAFHRLENGHSGKLLAVREMSLEEGGRVVQHGDNATGDQAWQLRPHDDGRYTIRNGYSGLVLGVEDASTDTGARVLQYPASEDDSRLWTLEGAGEERKLLRNVHSELVLGVDGMSDEDGAQVVQAEDNGTDDHLWTVR